MLKEITYDNKENTGLKGFGGLRKLEDLRIPFIISLRVQKMSGQEPVNKL